MTIRSDGPRHALGREDGGVGVEVEGQMVLRERKGGFRVQDTCVSAEV